MISSRSSSPYQAVSRPTRTVVDGAPKKNPNIVIWALDMVRGHGDEAAFPDISGFAEYSDQTLLGVRDTKPFHLNTSVVGMVDKETGSYQGLDMDWSATGTPCDLEAVCPTEKKGQYLAVEGTALFGSPHLYQLEVSEQGGRSLAAHPLPDLGQEIEGLVSNGRTVIFGGRGDGDTQARLYWGTLGEEGLTFTQEGKNGVPLEAPFIAESQRGITELVADQDGGLWAAATATVGGIGEYRSAVYQLGHLREDGERPFALQPGEAFFVDGPKVEALAVEPTQFYMGSDNESLKGRLDVARNT